MSAKQTLGALTVRSTPTDVLIRERLGLSPFATLPDSQSLVPLDGVTTCRIMIPLIALRGGGNTGG